MFNWVKAACGLAACGLFLVACASEGTVGQSSGSSDKPLVISAQVAAHLEQYQGEIDAGRSGAFAVNEAGNVAFYSICDHGNCHGVYNFSSKAIRGCEKFGRGRCVILAANGSIKRPYTVGDSLESLLSQLQAPSAPDFFSGDRIRRELSGNSIIEANFEGKIWAEYFDPSGALRGRTEDGRLFDGAWKIDGNTLCVDYNSIARDWCGEFAEASDGSIDYYKDGKFRKNYSRSVLQKGNPQKL
jgi:hypothetical protein